MCVCDTGYQLDDDHMMCVDINECDTAGEDGVCGPGGKCFNLEGGYECECGKDYMRSEDGRGCVDMRKDVCYLKYSEQG